MWFFTDIYSALDTATLVESMEEYDSLSMEWYDGPSKTILSELSVTRGFGKRCWSLMAKCREKDKREPEKINSFPPHFTKIDGIMSREQLNVTNYGYRFGLIVFCVLLRFWPRHKPINFSLGEYERIVRKYQQEFRNLSNEYITQGHIPGVYPFYVNCNLIHEVRNIINEVVPYSEDFFEERWKNLHRIIDNCEKDEKDLDFSLDKMFYWNRMNHYYLSKIDITSNEDTSGK